MAIIILLFFPRNSCWAYVTRLFREAWFLSFSCLFLISLLGMIRTIGSRIS